MKNYPKTNTGKTFVAMICALLVIVLIGGITVGVLSDGFRSWDKFQKPDKGSLPSAEVGAVTDENGNELNSETIYPLSRNLTFTAPTAEAASASNGITVSATVYPVEATNKELDWSVAFVNSQSTWASGKSVTDYVTVTPDANESSLAVIRCLAAFGERIKIRVTSRDNPDAFAECIADYGSRVVDGQFKLESEGFVFEFEDVLPFFADFADISNLGEYFLYCELNPVYDPVYTKINPASSDFVLRANPFIKHLLALTAPIGDLGYSFGDWEISSAGLGDLPLCFQIFDMLLIGDPSDATLELHSLLISTLIEILSFPKEEFLSLIDTADDPDWVQGGYDRFAEYVESHSGMEEYQEIIPLFELAGNVNGNDCFMPLGVRLSDLMIPVASIDLSKAALEF